jgi:putative ABC transport system substrate-binding protein
MNLRRRTFITLLGGAAAWPGAARAQQRGLPLVAYISGGSREANARLVPAFRKGLGEAGYAEGQNVAVQYDFLEGRYDRIAALLADLIQRHVAVITTPGSTPAALAAKAATATIPIVFGVGQDPVQLGLVGSLAHPGGNATGFNLFTNEVVAKVFGLLHDLVPKAVRVAVLVNPTNPATTLTLQHAQDAASTLGLNLHILNATTVAEIDAAFTTLARDRPDALYVSADSFFISRTVQFATLTARERLPSISQQRDFAAAGGLMSYGTDLEDMARQVGIYAGRILKGAKPADLPVPQSTKFQLVVNLQTARALNIDVPSGLLAIADEVLE